MYRVRRKNVYSSKNQSGINEAQLPMWHFYAKEQKGYCVKYKVNDKKNIRPIIYGEDSPSVPCPALSSR